MNFTHHLPLPYFPLKCRVLGREVVILKFLFRPLYAIKLINRTCACIVALFSTSISILFFFHSPLLPFTVHIATKSLLPLESSTILLNGRKKQSSDFLEHSVTTLLYIFFMFAIVTLAGPDCLVHSFFLPGFFKSKKKEI